MQGGEEWIWVGREYKYLLLLLLLSFFASLPHTFFHIL
jgi:hypothetical protein